MRGFWGIDFQVFSDREFDTSTNVVQNTPTMGVFCSGFTCSAPCRSAPCRSAPLSGFLPAVSAAEAFPIIDDPSQ